MLQGDSEDNTISDGAKNTKLAPGAAHFAPPGEGGTRLPLVP